MIRLLTVALLFASFHAAAEVNLTELNNNTPADADDVMGNFNALKQGVDANATAIDALPTPPTDCDTNQIIKWNGSAWVCATDALAGLSCEERQTIMFRNGAWQCAGCVAPGVLITDANFSAAVTDWFDNGDTSIYGPISQWCTGDVTNMGSAFYSRGDFNEDIGGWDTGNVTSMYAMFREATSFNQDIGGWDTSNVTDMNGMFYQASAFNQDIGRWDVRSAEDMSFMFFSNDGFNQDLSSWDASPLCYGFAQYADTWRAAYGGSIRSTPPLSASMIAAGCGLE